MSFEKNIKKSSNLHFACFSDLDHHVRIEKIECEIAIGIALGIMVLGKMINVMTGRKLHMVDSTFSWVDFSVSYVVFKANPVVSILSTFVANLLYSVFLKTSSFTTLLSSAKSSGTDVSFAMSIFLFQFLN